MSAPAIAARNNGLRTWAALFDGVTPISEITPRTTALCVGVINRIRLVPGAGVEVTLEDGTGRLRASWTGRGLLAGLELGRGLRLQGMVCTTEDGELLLRNPRWCLVADPYACKVAGTRPSARVRNASPVTDQRGPHAVDRAGRN